MGNLLPMLLKFNVGCAPRTQPTKYRRGNELISTPEGIGFTGFDLTLQQT
jgi:hypothetical protein